MSRNHRWITAIIHGQGGRHEHIFIDRKEWCLCLDKHHGHDQRYLVIFKDESLKTIRDLRGKHMPLLREIECTVMRWIEAHHHHKYYMYFHYMPSVFQLHLHVNSNTVHINKHRAHHLSFVMQKLEKNHEHFKTALILTSWCKTMRKFKVNHNYSLW